MCVENLNPFDQAYDREIKTNRSHSRVESTKNQAPLATPFFQVYDQRASTYLFDLNTTHCVDA